VKRGNHKSAEAEPTKVAALLAKDVRHGFSLPHLRGHLSRLQLADRNILPN
jgi:hypothetical protein